MTKEKQFKIKNAKDANSKLHLNFKLFFEALNLLHKEKISSYKKLIGSENFKFFKKNLSIQKIQNLKKNFEEEIVRGITTSKINWSAHMLFILTRFQVAKYPNLQINLQMGHKIDISKLMQQ